MDGREKDMVANFQKIIPDQTDRNSPISENLMDTIRTNFDALNDAVDEISTSGDGGGNGDGGDPGDGNGGSTVTVPVPVVAELRGDLGDISPTAPLDFPLSLRPGQLKKAKVRFHNLSRISDAFDNSVTVLRRSDRQYLIESITSRFSSRCNFENTFTPGHGPRNYAHLGETHIWSNPGAFPNTQQAVGIFHDGNYGIIALGTAPNPRIWTKGTKITQNGQTKTFLEEGTILSYDETSRIVVFRVDSGEAAQTVSRVNIDALVYRFDLDGSPGTEYVIGELCNFGLILDKNVNGENNVILRQEENAADLSAFQEEATGTLVSGRVEFSYQSSDIPSNYPSLSAFFSVDSKIFIIVNKNTQLLPTETTIPAVVVSVNDSSFTVVVKNQVAVSRGGDPEQIYINRAGYMVASNERLAEGEHLYVFQGFNALVDSPYRVISKIGNQRFLIDTTEEEGAYNTSPPSGVSLDMLGSRLRMPLNQDVSEEVKVGGYVSFATLSGEAFEYFEVVETNVDSGENIVVETGRRLPEDYFRTSRANKIFAYYETIVARAAIEDSSVTRLDHSREFDISAQIEPMVENNDEWTLSVLFSKLTPGTSGISVEVV